MRDPIWRFFAALRSKPRGFPTTAMPAAPPAPSFRNSRRVSSGIPTDPFYAAVVRPSSCYLSLRERVVRNAGAAVGRGCRASGREDPSARARTGRGRGAPRARARRRPYKGAPLRAARLVHGRPRRGAVADGETRPLRRRRRRLHPRDPRTAGERVAAELTRARRGSCPGAWGLSLTAPCPSCTVAGRYGVRGRVLGPAARERPHFPCHPRRAPGQDPRRASSSEPLGSAIDVETVLAEKTNERH